MFTRAEVVRILRGLGAESAARAIESLVVHETSDTFPFVLEGTFEFKLEKRETFPVADFVVTFGVADLRGHSESGRVISSFLLTDPVEFDEAAADELLAEAESEFEKTFKP